MKPSPRLRSFLSAIGGSVLVISSASAADGTWTADSNGNWSDTNKWDGNIVADGIDSTAFLGDGISNNRTITLDSARTIGNITAQDTTHNYTISGAQTLTFDTTSGTPTISVVENRILIFTSTIFAGNDGLKFNGPGNFHIWQATLNHTGGTIVDGGATLLTNNNLGSGNWRLDNGMLSDRYRTTTIFSSGLGAGDNQVQVYGASGFGGGNGNSNWRIGTQNSVLKWGTVGEGATGFFNPTTLKFLSPVDNMGTSIYGQITLQNGIDLNSGSRTIDVLQAAGPSALHSSWAKIDAGIKDTGTGGSLTKTGGGNLLIAGTSDYNGSITINAGAVRFDSIASMSSSGSVQVNDGAILGVRVAGSGYWSGGTSGAGTLGGLIAGVGTTDGTNTSTISYSGNVGLLLDVTANTSSSATITNAGATSLALYKMGSSSLTLNGDNSYSGGTFLQQGTLIADSANALGSGDITFRGGTLQYTAASAATDYSSRIKNSASAISLNTNGQDVTLSNLGSGNTGGLTKSGSGTLTFSGTNAYTGSTLLNGGALRVFNGTLSTTTLSASGDGLSMLVDGNGSAGSAIATFTGNLVWGKTATNSTLTITDGGQMNVYGQVQTGNPYYSLAGGANISIGGGTATSTLSGDGGDDFYIGYGERRNSNNNVVTVSDNGVLTNIRDMFVGNVNNQQNASAVNPSTANQLTVTGTGTASMRGISVGYAQNAGTASLIADANANVVEVTNGGTLSTTGTSHVGRANNNYTESSANTLTVTGTGSTWNAGNQNVFVGFTNSSTATSNDNILTVGAGALVTNVATLTVGSGSGTETGNQLVVNGSLTVNSLTVSTGNSLSGSGTINGAVTLNGTFSPGSSPGLMTFNDSLTLAGEASFEIDGSARGLGLNAYDAVDVGGALTYGGTLTLDLGALFDAGNYSFNLFDFGSQSGSFDSVSLAGLYSGSLVNDGFGVWGLTDGDNTWTFTQSTGDLQLVVIPEPRAALLGALGMLLLLRRRR